VRASRSLPSRRNSAAAGVRQRRGRQRQSEILHHAREHNCDLIVLGARERHGLSILIHRTEDSVLHGAPAMCWPCVRADCGDHPSQDQRRSGDLLLEDQSEPRERRYVFSYTITIRNEGEVPAKLLTRHWVITDANGRVQEVRGDGVVGEQPYLKPGQGFRYSSGAVLETPVGAMQGSYQMVADDGATFDANIRHSGWPCRACCIDAASLTSHGTLGHRRYPGLC